MLKKVALAVGVIALLLPVALAGVWLWGQVTSPVAAQSSAEAEHNPAEIITVVGQGSVRVKPDVARVSIGVESSAESIGEAVADNEAKMQAILAALKEAGIEEKDIQTMNYSIQLERYPEVISSTESSAEQPKPVYRVSNMLNVTIRDLESVGDVLDAAITAGANTIWGISFSVDDPVAAQGEARGKAIEDALARAGELAELNGVKLGPVMSVSEVIGGGAVPLAVTVERAAADSAGGSISPGEIEITYQVQVSYFIER